MDHKSLSFEQSYLPAVLPRALESSCPAIRTYTAAMGQTFRLQSLSSLSILPWKGRRFMGMSGRSGQGDIYEQSVAMSRTKDCHHQTVM